MEKRAPEAISRQVCDTHQCTLFQEALVQVMEHLVRACDLPRTDEEHIHALALEALVHALLGTEPKGSVPVDAAREAMEGSGLGPLSAEQVGHLYEYGRGFRPEVTKQKTVSLHNSAFGKRNQGLFYTPQTIVRHIVDASLDALRVREHNDLLHLKLLDPAVGTGTFLLYALEDLTERALKARDSSDVSFAVALGDIRETFRETALHHGVSCDPDEETAIRIHLMSSCLYGVDLDPVAVHIAKTALKRSAFRDFPQIPGMEPHIQMGNALIGSASQKRSDEGAPDLDETHAHAYFGRKLMQGHGLSEWMQGKKVLHWSRAFPEVFSRERGGFDCVIGNPPYEIVSVKESGLDDRKLEQRYFRATYRTCQGKINTYRLMTERGLTVLRDHGVLGFIVPATLLADLTAETLRRMILRETRVIESLVIPETAQAFEGVTQAFLVLVCRKGERTLSLATAVWDGVSPAPRAAHTVINTNLVERLGYRIPLLRSPREKALLETLMMHPRLGGDEQVPRIAQVHQGEMNLTVDRVHMTASRTDYPLIRGEHVMPLRICHPSRQEGRLDWIVPDFPEKEINARLAAKDGGKDSGGAVFRHPFVWEKDRIVLGRVVNMETPRRLKAAAVSGCQFLGDMTNYIADATLPSAYLLGVLNSRVLNWRIRLTSTNNYLSATEVEALPVPRPVMSGLPQVTVSRTKLDLLALFASSERSLHEWIDELKRVIHRTGAEAAQSTTAHLVAWIADEIQHTPEQVGDVRNPTGNRWTALDAAVLLLYGCDEYADVLLEA